MRIVLGRQGGHASAQAAITSIRDAALGVATSRLTQANAEVYGARKVRRQRGRERIELARCPASETLASL